MTRPRVEQRLAMVLAVVPWLAEHGGSTVQEVADRFDLPPEEVLEVLSAVQCCEVPPYGGATLGIAVFPDGEIVVDPLVAFERPLDLTADEAFGLLTVARAALSLAGGQAGDPLARAVDELERRVGGELEVDLEAPELLDELRPWVAEGRVLELSYLSANRDELTERTVEPWGLVSSDGHWYLVAHCRRAGGRRTFRVDRIDRVVPTAETVTPPPDPDLDVSVATDAPPVTLRAPLDRAWVLDGVPVDSTVTVGDELEVVLPVASSVFLEQLVLRLGPGTRVLEPEHLRDLPAETARRLLERYEQR